MDLEPYSVVASYPITTDKLGSYPKALRRLKRKGELKDTVQHRTSKYLINIIEADHGALKRLIRPTRGFQSMKTAYATIKGFETAFGHHFLKVPVADAVAAVPADAEQDDLGRKPAALEHRHRALQKPVC